MFIKYNFKLLKGQNISYLERFSYVLPVKTLEMFVLFLFVALAAAFLLTGGAAAAAEAAAEAAAAAKEGRRVGRLRLTGIVGTKIARKRE